MSDNYDGEEISGKAVEVLPPTSNTGLAWANAEIDRQIATAKAYPRLDDKKMLAKLIPRVTLSIEVAEACVYTLPRGNKNIEGPSIRCAELLFQTWGNCRVAAEFVGVNREDGLVIVKGTFFDLEQNTVTQSIEPRRITGKNGRLFSPDMIAMTAKAAVSIAKRNAILSGISPGVVRETYRAARELMTGDVKNFEERRFKAFERFSEKIGVDKATIFKLLMIDDESQMRPNHLPVLRGFYNAIVQGEETVDTLMRLRGGAATGADFETVQNPLRDEVRPAEKAAETTAAKQEPEPPKETKVETAKEPVEKTEAKPEPKPEPEVNAERKPEPKPEPAAVQKAEPEAKKDDAVPVDDAGYLAHATAWIASCGTITQIDDRWKREKRLRLDCKVTPDTLEALDEIKSARINHIRTQ